jgi:hypothetical protein
LPERSSTTERTLGAKHDNPGFHQQSLAERRLFSRLTPLQSLSTIPVKNCSLMVAEDIPQKLYKGYYVFSLKVKRKVRLSFHRI